ncbi:Hypothetical predicted protein [Olea europaea subsp. europaea]|uniref:Uncharacterized protein n=1 Tax=Olea europaea subsp. europaea TaxID=158383 RepID=A0A8S0TSI7_OLEEU|nr:Hypothetical predicted protein [Olea europaea subsp. europaea]
MPSTRRRRRRRRKLDTQACQARRSMTLAPKRGGRITLASSARFDELRLAMQQLVWGWLSLQANKPNVAKRKEVKISRRCNIRAFRLGKQSLKSSGWGSTRGVSSRPTHPSWFCLISVVLNKANRPNLSHVFVFMTRFLILALGSQLIPPSGLARYHSLADAHAQLPPSSHVVANTDEEDLYRLAPIPSWFFPSRLAKTHTVREQQLGSQLVRGAEQ